MGSEYNNFDHSTPLDLNGVSWFVEVGLLYDLKIKPNLFGK